MSKAAGGCWKEAEDVGEYVTLYSPLFNYIYREWENTSYIMLSQANVGHSDSSPCINLLSPICCKQNSHVRVYTHCQDVAGDSTVAVMYCLDALMALQGPTTTTHLLFLLNSCQFFQTLFCHHLVLHSVYFKTVSGLILQ